MFQFLDSNFRAGKHRRKGRLAKRDKTVSVIPKFLLWLSCSTSTFLQIYLYQLATFFVGYEN